MFSEKDIKNAYDFLISKKIVEDSSIEEAFKTANEKKADIFVILVGLKKSKEEKITEAKAEFLGVKYINLNDVEINKEILKEVPEKAALFYRFIPFGKEGDVVKFAMIDLTDIESLDALKFISARKKISTEMYLASEGSFSFAFKQYKTLTEELKDALENVNKKIRDKSVKEKEEEKEVSKIIEEAPVSKIVDIILTHAIEGKASDVHVEPLQEELRIRYRLDGVLHNSLILPKKISAAVVSRIKILSDLKIDETRKPQDGRFRFNLSSDGGAGKSVDLRVSRLPTVNGEKVVMRILDTTSEVGSLENLGLWGKGLEIIKNNIKKPFGILLITGPTGSGKSTTLYALLKILNREGVNIITLEDPVEYYMEGINQSQIHADIGYTFASGLRSILRQDPNIIMVGEIRDKETAELATHAALTGHLVLSTLHTNNSIGVIPRLIDMGIESFLISSSLNVAIAQRLVGKICGYCKKEIKMSKSIKEAIEKELSGIKSAKLKELDLDLSKEIKLFKGEGCKECKQSGIIGRIGIFEILFMTSNLESIISSKISDSDIIKEAERQEMVTIRQDGIIKAIRGITTIEEVFRVTEN